MFVEKGLFECDRFGRVERDLRQKRQLLDSQRDKMKTITQQAAKDKARTVSVRSMAM